MDPAREVVRATPCLRLFADTLYVGEDEIKTAMLRLDFEVAGKRTRRGPAGTSNDAARVLESLGAVELDQLEDCAVTPGTVVDYVIPGGDVHFMCAFTAYAVPQLRNLGWTVDIDKAYPWQVIGGDAPLYASAQPEGDWFALELGVEIDGHRVDLLPALLEFLDGGDLEQLARSGRRCVAVKVDERRFLTVPQARLKLIAKVLVELYRSNGGGKKARMHEVPLIAELCAAVHDGERPLRWIGDSTLRDRAYAIALGPSKTLAAPPLELRAELRPYQSEGVGWLQHLRAHDAGGILADDMGLGKTLQTIAHVLAEKQAGRLDRPAMIVTLTSLVGNWQREIAKFAPSLRAISYHGPHRKLKLGELASHDVIVTTYPLVARDRDELAEIPLHLLVLDEAHAIKTHDTLAADAVRALPTRHRVCLSGTPIENHLGELWSLFDFLMPGLLGGAQEFAREFREPIEQKGDRVRLEALRDRVRPYILRRTKDAVAPELPAKTQLVRAVELTGAQRELYESIRLAAHADVRTHIKQHGMARSTIAILDALLKLRQVCCDPRLAAVPGANEAGSAKLDVLLELLQSGIADGRRVLVFSQFARMLGLISEALLARGVRHVTLTGSTADREKPIEAFQSGKADVFLISLKAGGAGLNLTTADTVIHYDPWWNPAVQAQATDRAHRIGQTKPVFVYDLIAAGSVEERMLGLQKQKRHLADAILSAGRPGLTEIDVEDLFAPIPT